MRSHEWRGCEPDGFNGDLAEAVAVSGKLPGDVIFRFEDVAIRLSPHDRGRCVLRTGPAQ